MQRQIEEFESDSEQLSQSAINKIMSEGETKSKAKRISVDYTTDFLDYSPSEIHEYRTTTDWINTKSGSIEPMISVNWGQGEPFNDKTPVVDGEKCPTGCVATAMAQLMSYWKYPFYYNWDLLNRYPYMDKYTYAPDNVKNEVSKLMYDIGIGVYMDYNPKGSSASQESPINYFSSIGFTEPGSLSGYDSSKVLRSLYSGCPVLMSGYDWYTKKDLKIWFTEILLSENYCGHCWVIDGALRQIKTTTVYCDDTVVRTTNKYRTLFHCNFGWYGSCDGYYASGAFNTNEGPVTKSIIKVTTGEDYNYQYKLAAIYNIHPY